MFSIMDWTWAILAFFVSIFRVETFAASTSIATQAENMPQLCPSDYHYYSSINTCLKLNSEFKVWDDAREHCQSESADLVIVRNEEADGIITGFVTKHQTPIWIGLRELENIPTKFRWIDGSPVVYERWGVSQPSDNLPDGPDCGLITQWRWDDTSCRSHLALYVCEKRPYIYPSCSAGYASYPGRKKCVKVVNDLRLSWDDARIECQRDGADLVIIPDSPYNAFISTLLLLPEVGNGFFIGLRNTDIPAGNQSFRWIDGSVLDYNEWLPYQPNYQSSDTDVCGEIYFSGGWNDQFCKVPYGFICEKDFYEPILCPGDDWFLSSNKRKCFKVRPQANMFPNSRLLCKKEGGDLVTMTDFETKKDMKRIIKPTLTNTVRHYWVGLKDPYKNFTYQWIDGTSLSASDPTRFILTRYHHMCAAFGTCKYGYCYVDKYCRSKNPFVCQKQPSSNHPVLDCPIGYTTHVTTRGWGITCLSFQIKNPATWLNASSDCEQRGGELFTFEDNESEWKNIFEEGDFIGPAQKYWSNFRSCGVFSINDGASEVKACKDEYPYICEHWGHVRRDLMVDLRELPYGSINVKDSVLQIGENISASLVGDVCPVINMTEVYVLYNETRLPSQAIITAEINLTQLLLKDQYTKCLRNEYKECCAHMTLKRPANSTRATMSFPIDKIYCLCPETIQVTPETINLLKNITITKSENGAKIPDKLCPCACDRKNVDFNPTTTTEVLNQMISKIQKELKKLSSKRIKKVSSKDNLTESKAIGYAGIALCLLPFCLMVFFDISVLFQGRGG